MKIKMKDHIKKLVSSQTPEIKDKKYEVTFVRAIPYVVTAPEIDKSRFTGAPVEQDIFKFHISM